MIPISKMKDGQGYIGSCSYSIVGVWIAKIGCFANLRGKFSNAHYSEIQHWDDPDRHPDIDGFRPTREATDEEVELNFGSLVLRLMRVHDKDR